MERLQEWRRIALDGRVVRRALATAACVGMFLTLINQAATLQSGDLDGGVLVQIALTVLVPYAVSTLTATAITPRHDLNLRCRRYGDSAPWPAWPIRSR